MAYVCPECLTPGSLDITLSIQLPSDSRSDDIVVQTVECFHCRWRGAAVYEESRRGALDSEAWDHSGYRIEKQALESLAEAIRRCPKPSSTECRCPTHRSLGQTDAQGRWLGLAGHGARDSFPMRLVP